MEKALARPQPITTFIPYTLLVVAMVIIFINALNKVELQPFETEYPEAFCIEENVCICFVDLNMLS